MQRRLGLSLSNDARSCGASQDYLLGYVCYRCGKVKQTNFKVHSLFYLFLFPVSLASDYLEHLSGEQGHLFGAQCVASAPGLRPSLLCAVDGA